jgi:hypothetical protein
MLKEDMIWCFDETREVRRMTVFMHKMVGYFELRILTFNAALAGPYFIVG